jgi:hypothetical protein
MSLSQLLIISSSCSREASCAFIHERIQRVLETATTTASSLASPIRLSPSKFGKSSSPARVYSQNGIISSDRTSLSQQLCCINFIPGRETAAEFSAGAAGKGWAWLPSYADDLEEGQQQLRDAKMIHVFASIIHRCSVSTSVILGMNPAEPINSMVLQAAAVDLPRLKAM